MPFYQSEKHLPRGEMWLGRGLFGELGWKDDLAARVRLCRELAMDIIFFSVDSPSPHHHSFDYNYFSLGYVLRLIVQKRALPVGIIIDGPFEQLAHQLGLQELLHRWRDEKDRLLPGAAAQVAQVFSACLEAGPDAIVIADDIAYHQSTYVNPTDLEASLFGFYRDWVAQAHRLGIPVLFHSDGRLSGVLPALLDCGFDGLAACQLEYLELNTLSRYQPVILGGIPNDLLEAEHLDSSHQEKFVQTVTALNQAGHLVLCSNGLSSTKHLSNLKILYNWVDEIWKPKSK